jgi:hypothetical protein
MISMPVPSKSDTLRVASVAPWDRQTAAISASKEDCHRYAQTWEGSWNDSRRVQHHGRLPRRRQGFPQLSRAM